MAPCSIPRRWKLQLARRRHADRDQGKQPHQLRGGTEPDHHAQRQDAHARRQDKPHPADRRLFDPPPAKRRRFPTAAWPAGPCSRARSLSWRWENRRLTAKLIHGGGRLSSYLQGPPPPMNWRHTAILNPSGRCTPPSCPVVLERVRYSTALRQLYFASPQMNPFRFQ